MNAPSGWRLAARIARREARGGLGALRLLFVCVLLGVLAIAAVGSLASAITAGMARQGQVILGGDVEARLSQRRPTAAETTALGNFGGTLSDGVRMRAMVRGETGAAAGRELLIELKAVDGKWPLYGEARLQGGGGNAAVQQRRSSPTSRTGPAKVSPSAHRCWFPCRRWNRPGWCSPAASIAGMCG